MNDNLNINISSLEDHSDDDLKCTALPPKLRFIAKNTPKDVIANSIFEADETYKVLLKQSILDGRIDILATYVLGFDVIDFHRELLQFQFDHPQSLQMVFRGAGKTTILSVAKCIWYLCVNPNVRIIIVSRTSQQAISILKEIKHHLQFNDILISLFGNFAPSSLVDPTVVWNEREINILQRTKFTKESNITAIGAEGAVVSKHYDVAIIDDLLDEENCRTAQQRDRIKNFYYKTLDPCLEPAEEGFRFRGERHIIGTRYHPEDLYGHLKDNELKEHTQIIPALTEIDNDKFGKPIYKTPWPKKFSIEYFLNKRKALGSIIFDSQFQCDIELMRGEVFKPEWFTHENIYYEELPPKTMIWSAADLAISTDEKADKFALVTIGKFNDIIYLIDFVWGRFSFNQQTTIIGEQFEEHQPIRTGVESIAYQAAQIQNLESAYPKLKKKIIPIYQKFDKVTRAWKLTSIFESKLVRIKKSHEQFISHMIGFRKNGEDDLFDAFEMAVMLSSKGVKKRRAEEPGVL